MSGSDLTLGTERLVLRRSVPGDAEAISAYRSDPEVSKFQGWERTDVEGLREQFAEMASNQPGVDGWVQFSVFEREADVLVGDVGISPAADEPGVIKVGYTMAPEFQGRGYATEAVRALVAYAFGDLSAARVRMYASADNIASIRVVEKVGFTLVETFEEEEEGETWRGVRYELERGAFLDADATED